jgi:hypothetical protein
MVTPPADASVTGAGFHPVVDRAFSPGLAIGTTSRGSAPGNGRTYGSLDRHANYIVAGQIAGAVR